MMLNILRKLLLFIPLILILFSCSKTPDDNSMIDHFRVNKSDFEKLVKMIKQETQLRRLALDFIDPDDYILKKERLIEYRIILKKIGIKSFYRSSQKDNIDFTYNTQGISVSGQEKGYAYYKNKSLISKDFAIVENLDVYYKAKRKSGKFLTYSALRHIEDEWYLFHDVDD
ncbi:MAG: hypothetical protein V1874_06480 [Spirochaetota bacterium]